MSLVSTPKSIMMPSSKPKGSINPADFVIPCPACWKFGGGANVFAAGFLGGG